MKKIEELTESEYKEFFEWLLEKDVKLDKTLDFTMASTFNEPYVYYPEEIADFLKTKPMQRLKRIEQLGTSILKNSDVSHTRYDHCLGTYNNAVLFYMLQYKNSNWKKSIEDDGRKVEVLANIMEALRHDDGHNILSHALENLIGQEKGAHEVLGARFKEEYQETIDAINKIHPDLLETMKEVSKPSYNLITLREGNLDFDRLDFLSRDSLYMGIPEKKRVSYELLEKSKLQTVTSKNGMKEIIVYDRSALPYIEDFIETRAELYIKGVASNERTSLDILEEQFCQSLLESDIQEGKELKKYLEHCKNSDATNINLEQFLEWNDLKYYNELIEIAMGEGDEAVRKLAVACLPNIEALCSLAIESLDPREMNPKEYTSDDITYLENVKAILKEEHPLHNKLLKGTTKDIMVVLDANSQEEVQDVLKKLKDKGLTEQELSQIITWSKKTRKYHFDETIYVKGRTGEIFKLEEHPELSIDLSDLYSNGAMIIPEKLHEKGVSTEKIELIKKEFEDFNELHSKDKFKNVRRMRKFQIGNEPYIPTYNPTGDEER